MGKGTAAMFAGSMFAQPAFEFFANGCKTNGQLQAAQMEKNRKAMEKNRKAELKAIKDEIKAVNEKEMKLLGQKHQMALDAQHKKVKKHLEEIAAFKAKEEKQKKEIEMLKNYPPLKHQLTEAFKRAIKVAFVGSSKAGKSTLINTLRNLKSKDLGAAPIGNGVEKTLKATRYGGVVCRVDGVKVVYDIYDNPGYGTVKNPIRTHLRDIGVRYYDIVVLVVKDVISAADLDILEELEKFAVEVIVVRNHVQIHIQSALEEGDDVEKVLENIRADCRKQGIDEIFLLSSYFSAKKLHDFPKFEKKLHSLIQQESLRRKATSRKRPATDVQRDSKRRKIEGQAQN